MNVGFWIRDFQVLETEVQMIMDLIGRKVKIRVKISSGKYSHPIDSLRCCLTLPPISKRERTNEGRRRLTSVERSRELRRQAWNLDFNPKNLLSSSFFNIAFVHNIYLYSLFFFFFIKQIYFFVLEALENIIMFVGCHFVLKILRFFFWETIEKCFFIIPNF